VTCPRWHLHDRNCYGNHGCRCFHCRVANTEYMRRRRTRLHLQHLTDAGLAAEIERVEAHLLALHEEEHNRRA
jgi:hypothetical protein